MAAARLTRGGFYGHFASKADLFAEALGQEHGFVRLLRERRGRSREALGREAMQIVGDYLHPDHRAEVGQGCYLAALSADVARAGRPARRAYQTAVRALADELSRGLDGPAPLDPRALATIALCVGGLTVARAIDDEALAAAMLRATERVAREQLERSA
jgi:TetR/AcrR family transcriptional repressor of nem operon